MCKYHNCSVLQSDPCSVEGIGGQETYRRILQGSVGLLFGLLVVLVYLLAHLGIADCAVAYAKAPYYCTVL